MIDIDDLRHDVGELVGRRDKSDTVFRQQAIGQVRNCNGIQTVVKSGRLGMAVGLVWPCVVESTVF